tara:strand:- start:5267 stop:6541 length:1275 start_codon:yes stop_codon:yes gene_type:complete
MPKFDSYAIDGSLTGTERFIIMNDDNVTYNVTLQSLSAYVSGVAEIGVETDPIFIASPAFGITGTNRTNWSQAYAWGNHASAGYITGYTETEPLFTASVAAGILAGDLTNWNTAFGWGDHSTEGYLVSGDIDTLAELNAIIVGSTLIDTTDSRLSDARTPIAHTHSESQITDLQPYLLSVDISDINATGVASSANFLRGDGAWVAVAGGGGGDALVANPLSQFAATTSAQLATVISDETGSGALVFANSPVFTGSVVFPSSISLGGAGITRSGLHAMTLTTTGVTNVTLPTTGTLATRNGAETLLNKTLVAPILGVATATSINGATITSGTLNGTVTGTNTGDQVLPRQYVDSTSNGLTGTQNGANTAFTVSQSSYVSGGLLVFVSGYPLSAGQGLTETTPASGIFTLDTAPEAYDIIIVQYTN